ncbi:MAG: translation initiation factor IF-2 [Planctomycetaceae bacterium]|nr:translation initiation factor IF-2 [Planctomycetaceae bacterium]
MAKRRVFEIARDLGVTSKAILHKCQAEGIDLDNHMSTVSAGLEETITEWFSQGQTITAVETTEPVDLEREHAEATKARRRRGRGKTAAEEPAAETAAEPAAVAEEPAPAEQPEQPPVEEQPPAPPEEPLVEQAPAPAPQPVQAAVPEAPAPAPQEPPAEPAAEPPQAAEPVKPVVMAAGPQVVPRPAVMKGPKVVRVERPEAVESPRRRRPPMARPAGVSGASLASPAPGAAPKKILTAQEEEEEARKTGKKRSPRRRGRGAADGGDKIKEWGNVDLEERSLRLASAGGGLRRHRANVTRASTIGGPNVKTGKVEIAEPISIKGLSEATGIKTAELIKKLMGLGTMATINQVMQTSLAETIVAEYGIELVVQMAHTAQDKLLQAMDARVKSDLVNRAPVVAFLGHVDHGKTSLLDRIRDTAVADGEAGGITQHIGAYRYDKDNLHVVFLDTPGHEAFTAMRARGANMTDVVVLVVAADDGVMPQTAEAISHAKAAGVALVVACNKIDLPGANVQRLMGQLAEHGVTVREWGGDVEMIQTSAVTGKGVPELIELLSLEAEILELKAEEDAPATGFVIESQMDPGRGVVARLLVRNGTLRIGDVLVAGRGFGRVRSMIDSHGRSLREAGPSMPIEVAGLDEIPQAGDRFYVVENIESARNVASEYKEASRSRTLTNASPLTLDNLFSRIEDGAVTEVPMILKADVQGSIEALTGTLGKLSTGEVRVNILHAAVGGISTGDVTLAQASGAIIVGFNVVADSAARALAEEKKIGIRLYRIIYEVVDDIRKLMSEGLKPEIRQETLGRAEVRQVFKISRIGTVAGCIVSEGRVARNAKVRIIRNNVVVSDERTVESLKRHKDDVREARSGTECGIKLLGYDDVKEGDSLEFYQQTEVARSL